MAKDGKVSMKATLPSKSNRKLSVANLVAYKPNGKSNNAMHDGARPSNINDN